MWKCSKKATWTLAQWWMGIAPWWFSYSFCIYYRQLLCLYSPDLAPALFPKLKSPLNGRRFDAVERIKKNDGGTTEGAFSTCFKQWNSKIKSFPFFNIMKRSTNWFSLGCACQDTQFIFYKYIRNFESDNMIYLEKYILISSL